MVFCGLGGIFIEILKDVQSVLAPVSKDEALDMIAKLKGKKILEGIRGQKGINIGAFAEIITRVSALITAAPEIIEMDLNPLLGSGDKIIAVDARINILKNY
jgi:acetyltransferase